MSLDSLTKAADELAANLRAIAQREIAAAAACEAIANALDDGEIERIDATAALGRPTGYEIANAIGLGVAELLVAAAEETALRDRGRADQLTPQLALHAAVGVVLAAVANAGQVAGFVDEPQGERLRGFAQASVGLFCPAESLDDEANGCSAQRGAAAALLLWGRL